MKLKTCIKAMTMIGSTFGLIMLAEPALAANAGAVVKGVTDQLGSFAELLTGGSMVAGIGVGAMAAMKFKEHNADPRQTKLSTPITYMLVSGMLIGLPSVLTTTSDTIGATGSKGDVAGTAYNKIR